MIPECPHTPAEPPDAAGWASCACGMSLPPVAPPKARPLAPIKMPRALTGPKRVRFPIQWSEALEQKIVDAIKQGASRRSAAQAHGVGKELFEKWMRSEEEPFAGFAEAVNAAHRLARIEAEQAVKATNPRAWLQALARDEGGENGWNGGSASTVTVQGGTTVQHQHVIVTHAELSRMTLEELEARERDLAQKALPAHDGDVQDAEFEPVE